MFNPLRFFSRPEYLFRPSQVLHRFRRLFAGPPSGEFITVKLPWGAPLRVRPNEVIGANIWSYGIFDLIVAEAIARLLDRGETALDVGANIGQMTNLMRHCAGPAGKVESFEPNEEIFHELEFNMREIDSADGQAPVTLHQFGLSDTDGVAHLDAGEHWATNRGMSRIVPTPGATGDRVSQVPIKRLDHVLPADGKVGVCKIDVEGHEMKVLKGASQLLQQGRIRDILFEELDPYPSPLHRHLREAGFTLFSTRVSALRPLISQIDEVDADHQKAEAGNYLATLEPERAKQRFHRGGWMALKTTRER